MPSLYEFTWKLEAPIADKNDSKATLFVRFFTEDILEQNSKEATILILTWTL